MAIVLNICRTQRLCCLKSCSRYQGVASPHVMRQRILLDESHGTVPDFWRQGNRLHIKVSQKSACSHLLYTILRPLKKFHIRLDRNKAFGMSLKNLGSLRRASLYPYKHVCVKDHRTVPCVNCQRQTLRSALHQRPNQRTDVRAHGLPPSLIFPCTERVSRLFCLYA